MVGKPSLAHCNGQRADLREVPASPRRPPPARLRTLAVHPTRPIASGWIWPVIRWATLSRCGWGLALTNAVKSKNVVWGENIVWGDNLVWRDHLVWLDNIVWGDNLVCENIAWGDGPVGHACSQAPPSRQKRSKSRR